MKPAATPSSTVLQLAGAFRCVGCKQLQGEAHAAGCAFSGLTACAVVRGG
jgi:hypothetical protein